VDVIPVIVELSRFAVFPITVELSKLVLIPVIGELSRVVAIPVIIAELSTVAVIVELSILPGEAGIDVASTVFVEVSRVAVDPPVIVAILMIVGTVAIVLAEMVVVI
jgi:hypothetical protein